jgi:Na+/melibiose symporter-like transporter
LLVPESKGGLKAQIDPVGVLMSIAGLMMLVYGIVHGGDTRDWGSPDVWGFIFGGIGVLALFVWFESRSDHPSLDIRLFENREFSTTLTAVTAAFFGLMGATFFLVFYLQLVRGMSPLQAGAALLPLAFGQFFAAMRSSKAVARFGPRVVIGSGLLLVGVVFASMLLVQADTTLWKVLVLYLLIGVGMGSAMAPATTVMMSTLPLARAGAGSAVQNTVRQVGGALGVAITGTVIAVVYGGQLEKAGSGLPASSLTQASGSLGATYEVVAGAAAKGVLPPDAVARALGVANESFITAMHVATLLTAAAALVGSLVAYRFLPRRLDAQRIAEERQRQFTERGD